MKDMQIASVTIGGCIYALRAGATDIGFLRAELTLEQKSEGLFGWFVRLTNTGAVDSPRVTDFDGLHLRFPVSGLAVLNTLRGDDCSERSFWPEAFALDEGCDISREPTGGRSSDTAAFPYFDIADASGRGLVCGIGWSGQWRLQVSRQNDELLLRAGQKDRDFVLHPGESVRSVRALLFIGEGGTDALRHEFVRLHRRYYSPVPELGRDTFMPVASACFDRYYWGNQPKDGKLPYFETEEAQLRICERAVACRHINIHWLDAFWFDGAFRSGVGNYTYTKGLPNGIAPIAEYAHGHGMRLIVWFEPVRCHKDTEVYRRFSADKTKIIDGKFVNIGDPEVWQFQYEHICKILDENRVDIYRQDFNICPLDFLRSIEAPDRKGIAQIRFVEGMYRLWDAIRERFPGILIDNCASGGRLIDVETCMRALPLWQSDIACRAAPAFLQNQHLGLSCYIPYHGASSFDESAYYMRSGATACLVTQFAYLDGYEKDDFVPVLLDWLNPETRNNPEGLAMFAAQKRNISDILSRHRPFSPERAERALADVLRLREYWAGDFTALTGPSLKNDAIIAYALDIPEESRGVAVILRRPDAPAEFTLRLPLSVTAEKFRLTFCDESLNESSRDVSSDEISAGIRLRFDTAPGSMLVFYRASATPDKI